MTVPPPDPAERDLLAPPRVRRAWYVLCASKELKRGKVIGRRLWGQPLVLFRNVHGQVGVFRDRCPHRNVPLSSGVVVGDTLRCAYHGWRFGTDGQCKAIPGLNGHCDRAAYAAEAHAVREQQGFVWVWGEAGAEPTGDPFVFRLAEDRSYLVVRREVGAPGSIHAVAENALDVPHTAFLHGGLFRSDTTARKPISCVITREADRVECEYVGEERPQGIIGRVLSPSGGTVIHFDRFYLPSIIEVEYRLGPENHVLVDAALTPVDDFETRLFAVVAVRTRIPPWLLRPIATPFALRIFQQDARVLAKQTATMRAFGEQRFVSTEIDLLGPHIHKLLQRGAQGTSSPPRAPTRREFTLLV